MICVIDHKEVLDASGADCRLCGARVRVDEKRLSAKNSSLKLLVVGIHAFRTSLLIPAILCELVAWRVAGFPVVAGSSPKSAKKERCQRARLISERSEYVDVGALIEGCYRPLLPPLAVATKK